MAGHLASAAMPDLSPDQVLAVSQLIGGLAGALTGQGGEAVYIGAGAAGNAVANNRLLHPSERELAQRLLEKAQKEGLPYTLEEIEAQMRLMGNALYAVEPNHAEVYANTAADATAFQALQASLAQDPSMPKGGERCHRLRSARNAKCGYSILCDGEHQRRCGLHPWHLAICAE